MCQAHSLIDNIRVIPQIGLIKINYREIEIYVYSLSSHAISIELDEDLRAFHLVISKIKFKLAEFWLQLSGPD